jgi:phospholipid/cholesterol/gamma-HCH transport system substrate-binding protein
VGANVEMAGVRIGQIDKISLDQERQIATVKLKIQNGIILTDDVIASVKTAGLIGDKYITLLPGGSDQILKPGDLIIETESAVDLEDLISKYVFGGV